MHRRDLFPLRKAFTLIELLVVIAIIAILAVVVVLTLNPAQLLAQSRDANRVSDMATLNSAIGLYQTDTGGIGSIGTSTVVYLSLPDSSSTCGSWNLPSLASSTYQCSTSTSSRLVNNQGWVPINFSQISSGAPFGSLPVDPVNTSSSGLYYSYVTSGTQYMVSAIPESQKQKQSLGTKPMVPNYPDIIANGSSLTINPLYNPNGLVGYWPMDEGAGSSAKDLSGSSNVGTWSGIPIGTNSTYYVGGKVGQWAGVFDGVTDQVLTGNLTLGSTFTVTAWVNLAILQPGNNRIAETSYTSGFYLGTGSGNRFFWIVNNPGVGGNLGGTQTPGQWQMVTGVYNGSTGSLYVNGVAVSTGFVTPSPGSVTLPVHIGNGGGFAQFNGLIDDVRVYSRALSAAEVLALYNAGK